MHYSVLVVTAERPNDRIIDEALRPFREEPDADYLQDVDVTESARERFLAASGTMLQAPDGSRHDAFSEEFFREPTLAEDRVIMACRGMDGAIGGVRFQIKGWADGFLAAKVRIIPDGWTEVPNPRGHNQTFAKFASEYHCVPTAVSEEAIDLEGDHSNGYVLVDEAGSVIRVVIRTNPNAHYDYWARPGRFAGIMNHLGGRDVCRRADLRMEQTASEYAEKRRAWANGMLAKFKLTDLTELHGHLLQMSAAKAEWRKLKEKPATFGDWLAERGMHVLAEMNSGDGSLPDVGSHATMEEWFSAARPLWAYAIVLDGIWHERERLPWWRDVFIDDEQWANEAWNIVADIPDDRWITVVDCHN